MVAIPMSDRVRTAIVISLSDALWDGFLLRDGEAGIDRERGSRW
jgi:hypothetical protein